MGWLDAVAQPRELPAQCPAQPQGLLVCVRYSLIVSGVTCRNCQAAPSFRQSLFADYVRHRAERDLPCVHRGAQVGTREVRCCGGSKNVRIAQFDCAQIGRVWQPDCWICGRYLSAEASAKVDQKKEIV